MNGSQELDDERLFEMAARDPESLLGRSAATRLLGRHRQRVYLWCRRNVHDHERALEMAEEVLLSAYHAMAGSEQRPRFTGWLFAITSGRVRAAGSADERGEGCP